MGRCIAWYHQSFVRFAPLNPQESRTGKVHLINQCLVAECQIPDWGKVIQVKVLVPRLFGHELHSPAVKYLQSQGG
jgi:hypothetical protein